MTFAGWLRPHRVLIALVAVAAGVLACRDTTTPTEVAKSVTIDPRSTDGSGFTSAVIQRGNLGTFDIESEAAGYEVELKSDNNTDIAVSNITIAAGGHSGWHYHPGPVLVVVKSGAITFYHGENPSCAGTRYGAGTVFSEEGGKVGIARNEGSVEATAVAIFFAPPLPSALRIDAPKPANCA